MRVGLVGYFGHGNLGDEMFVRVWQHFLHGHQATVYYHDESVEPYDAFVIGGGSLFLEDYIYHPFWPSQILARPVYVYGISVREAKPTSPLSLEAVQEQVEYIKRCRYVSARGEESLERLTKYGVEGVELVPDMAWSYPLACIRPANPHPSPRIGLSFAYNLFPDDEIEAALQQLAAKRWHAWFVPLHPGFYGGQGDEGEHQRWASRYTFERAVVQTNFDLDHRVAAVGWCDVYAGSRMHGLLCALRARVPIIPLMTPRMKQRELLTQVGLPLDWKASTAAELMQRLDEYRDIDWEAVWSRVDGLERRSTEALQEFVAGYFSGPGEEP